jgi:uncharacterized protein YuzE
LSWLLLPSLNIRSIADSLYIDLSHRPSVESREISEGVVLDYNASRHVVGIDIDNASVKVELHERMVSKVPFTTQTITG